MPRRPYRHKKVSPEFLTEIQDIIRGAERDAELVAGLIYNPVLDELYTAEKG